MTDDHGGSPASGDDDDSATDAGPAAGDQPDAADDGDRVTDADLDELREKLAEVEELRDDVEELADDVDDRTVHRDQIEGDLRRYVRRRVRRGHATGWGPYLVLLYGTVMTIGSFYFLDGVWAILAMLVIWLSTLGLYALMVVVGLTVTLVGLPGRLRDALGDLRG
jgi:hypothetical protein